MLSAPHFQDRFRDFKWMCLLALPLFAGCGKLEKQITVPEQTLAKPKEYVVLNVNDSGEGSLRQAIENANALPGKHLISFDAKSGIFSTPQTIILLEPLPELNADVTINAWSTAVLWKASGVTVSGNHRDRVFTVGPHGKLTIKALTVADGYSDDSGAGILNRGKLLVTDSTFVGNAADENGGAVMNEGGSVTVINSTFANNRAAKKGGGFSNSEGSAVITNCSFSDNSAETGGALYSGADLLMRNTILANSAANFDCVSETDLNPGSTHNLIESNQLCGSPISQNDPNFQGLGYYNGPTQTLPINAPSPAINAGDNASALDENGQPLQWDQRGNGDPRFVGGITDIGAVEYQRLP